MITKYCTTRLCKGFSFGLFIFNSYLIFISLSQNNNMEENNIPNQNMQQQPNHNQQFNNQFMLKNLPNSTGAMVLGIVSIFFSMIWCYWIGSIISLTCGIIGLVLAKGGQKLLDTNENQYTLSSTNNNNAGKIMSIIGICIASIELLVLIIVILFFGTLIGMGKNIDKWPY